MKRRLPLLLIALAVVAAATLWWTSRAPSGTRPASEGPLAGATIGGPFTLVNGDGRTVTERDFDGRYRLMYFGFSFCPDVCPTDMQKLAGGLRTFEKAHPERAAKVQPIFVSIDPARDTPAVVKEFTAAFHPRIVGLTGSQAQVDAALQAFRVYAAKRGEGENYLMDHSAMIYLFGPDGKPISFVAGDGAAADVTAELEKYVI